MIEFDLPMDFATMKNFLDANADRYNQPDFIEADPVQIPHRFSDRRDIEIAGFITATISWGNRKAIINNATRILDWMQQTPTDFVLNFQASDLQYFKYDAVHRTFNREDLLYFVLALQRIYRQHDSLEKLFLLGPEETDFSHSIERFRRVFFDSDSSHRSRKHVSSPYRNSAAKRLIMFLRWMVRQDRRGVDFGLWTELDPKYLSVPLDVHTGNISRELGLLSRQQNDWKAVKELDSTLRSFEPNDPAKYDFALFGIGVNGALKND